MECSVKKVFFKNFAKFTGKHLSWSLRHEFFPVNSAKFLRTPNIDLTNVSNFLVKI